MYTVVVRPGIDYEGRDLSNHFCSTFTVGGVNAYVVCDECGAHITSGWAVRDAVNRLSTAHQRYYCTEHVELVQSEAIEA